MAAKRTYTDEDKAAVFVALRAHQGAVAPSSRDTSVPEQTVRDWKRRWANGDWPEPDLEAVHKATSEVIADAERVRDKALRMLEDKLDQIKAPEKLATVYGILDDKIRLHKGLPTSRSESRLELPPAEDVRDRLIEGVRLALEAQNQRRQDFVDVEVVEQAPKALPARTE